MQSLDSRTVIPLLIGLSTLICLRIFWILPYHRGPPVRRKRGSPAHLMIVLGSGGHTAEMIYMLEKATSHANSLETDGSETPTTSSQDVKRLKWEDYKYRTWITGTDDLFSQKRAQEFEAKISSELAKSGIDESGTYTIMTVPRARRIHQPLWSSPISCLQCAQACILVLARRTSEQDLPDVILANGPATATVLIMTSVLLRFFNYRGCNSRGKFRTVYVESWARIKRLSLSGRILCWIADRVLVQWDQLSGFGARAEYQGVLCF